MNDMPPDVGARPGPRRFADEPTTLLPVVSPPPQPARPPMPAKPPKVEGRAVIVYEPEPRRPWALWVFTAVLVALTAGVILGQTEAYQEPRSGSVAAAQAEPLPSYQTPSAVPSPPAAQQITAPLGSVKERVLEVTGDPTLLMIRSSDLGDNLFTVTTLDGSVTPGVVDTAAGPQLNLTRTGTEVYLNSKVRWTLKLIAGSTEQQIDMRAGGLSGLDLSGASERTMLDLPKPAGAVALKVSGAIRELRIRPGDVPVRLRLAKGAANASVDGTPHKTVKSGAVYTSPGWKAAKDRYELKASAKLGSVIVDRVL